MSKQLHVKYRPKALEDVVGQPQVVKALTRVLKEKSFQSFLFSGPAGCGKTTFARIAAKMCGCDMRDIVEIDGATNTGIDAMRSVAQAAQYKPFGKSTGRAIIVDECHRLSRQAWDSMLKVVEEPPAHLFWFFCTTEPAKVPNTIRTRCATFSLKAVADQELRNLLLSVLKKEGKKVPDDVVSLVSQKSNGSPRQALVNLGVVLDCKTRKEAATAIEAVEDSDPVIKLCRLLLQPNRSFVKCAAIVNELQDVNAESVRIVVVNYLGSCLKGTKSDKDAVKFLTLLENFATPYNQSEGLSPLWLSIGRTIYA